MPLKQTLKRFVGKWFLGYDTCPVTGDYLHFYMNAVSVPISPHHGVLVSKRALTESSPRQLAEAVLEHSENWDIRYDLEPQDQHRYSLDEIASRIPSECTFFPSARKQHRR